jgi:hypothetical protein
MPVLRFFLCFIFSCGGVAVFSINAGAQKTIACTGVVLSQNTLSPISGATVTNSRSHTALAADPLGRFSFYSASGDTVYISHIGFATKMLVVPDTIQTGRWTILPLLQERATQLPNVTIRRPSPAQFGRDFITQTIPPDTVHAMQGLSPSDLKILLRTTPPAASEAATVQNQANAQAATHAGQLPQMQLFNVFAWRNLLRKKKKKH